MDFWQLLSLIVAQYPQLMPILKQPGIFAVVSQAVKENWPQARLEAALESTEYFKNTPKSMREWQALQVVDPASAGQRAQAIWDQVHALEDETGLKLGANDIQFVSTAAQQGWSEAQVRYHFLTAANTTGGTGGLIGDEAAQIHGMAAEYGVTLSDQATLQWAHQLAAGIQSPDSIKGYLIEQAKSLYPALAGALDQGITVAQYTDPYKQMAIQELGINPADFDLTKSKWNAPLSMVDQKTGQRTAMNLAEWQVKLRTDPSYGYDTGIQARSQAGQLATQIATKFGAIA